MFAVDICSDLIGAFRPTLAEIEEAEACITLSHMFPDIKYQFDTSIVSYVRFLLTAGKEYISCCNIFNKKFENNYDKALHKGIIQTYGILINQWRSRISHKYHKIGDSVKFLKDKLVELAINFQKIDTICAEISSTASTQAITNYTCPVEELERSIHELNLNTPWERVEGYV